MKYLLSLIVLTIFSFSASSQFKYVPKDISNAPEWALMMYSGNANLYEVEDMRAAYYRANSYEKDIHERNFQHWITQVSRLTDESGRVRSSEFWNTDNVERAGNAVWQPIGPMETFNLGSEGGFPVSWQCNAYCMDVSVSNPDVVIAGIEGGELFKSTDRGLSWNALTEQLPVATPTACRIAPNDQDVIYFFANGNFYRSTNGGSSWSSIPLSGSIYEIEVHPTNPNIVFACGSDGLKKSVDGGASFQTIISEKCWDVKYHPTNSSIVYALKNNDTANKCEFYKSVNGGDSFTIQANGWYSPTVVAEAEDIGGKIALSTAAANQIYVALIGASKDGDNGWIGVYKSTDAGSTWSNPAGQDGGPYDPNTRPNLASFNPDGTGFHQGFYNFAAAASQTDPDRLWVGSLSLSLSTDGGASFERIGGYYTGPNDIGWIHPDCQDLVAVGGDVWVATDGGVNYSSDDLATHESRKAGIYNSTFWGYNQGWNQDIMVGGRYHNGNTGFFETYPEGDHLRLGGAESPTGYVNPLLERKVYFSDITDHYLPATFSDGKTNTGNMGLYPTEGYWTSESSEVEFDPRYAGHMYLGKENKIYKSVNEGGLFESLYFWGANAIVYEIEVCRQNPERLYAVVRSGGAATMYYTTDGGTSWAAAPTDPGNSSKMEISVDPTNDDVVWAIEVNSGTVFRTTDGGSSWEDMTTSILSGHQLRDVIVQGGSDVVYIVSNTSAFYWDNDASEWVDYGAGLPAKMDALELRIFYKESKLRLADKGKGIWEAPLVEPSIPVAQAMTLNDQVYCSRDTVQFDCFSILNHSGANWSWTFDPAPLSVSNENSRNPRVVFGANGVYNATLNVTDGSGNMASSQITVSVNSNCDVDSVPGMALECLGSGNDYANTPELGVTTNTFTITAWVKPDGIQPDYTAIAINNGTTGGFNFRGGNNTLGYHWPGGAWWWDSGLIVPEDVWSHVAFVVAPNEIKVYVNGVSATHSVTAEPVDMESMSIGSYKGWASRNYSGLIDELKVWNRSLSQDEIREQRHLTLTQDMIDADPTVLLYYQFNEQEGAVLDRKGVNHASLIGQATRSVSDGPFGKGESDRVTISSNGTINFPNTESSMDFGSGATLPDGEVVLSRINVLPNELPTGSINFNGYFVLNNYGSNSSFDANGILLKPSNYSQPPSGWQVNLYQRGPNEHLNNWMQNCTASQVSANGMNFNAGCDLMDAAQFFLATDQFVGTEDVEEQSEVNVYPNPTLRNGEVQIENMHSADLRFMLYDSQGKIIASHIINSEEKFQFRPQVATGVYNYSLQGDDFIKNGRLIVAQ